MFINQLLQPSSHHHKKSSDQSPATIHYYGKE